MVEHALNAQLACCPVPREKQDVLIKVHQALADRVYQEGLLTVAGRRADSSAQQGITGKQGMVNLEDHTIQTMAWNVYHFHRKIADVQYILIFQTLIGEFIRTEG